MALVPHGGNRRAALAALAAGAVYQRGAARLSDAALRAAYNAATGAGSKFYNAAKENMKRHWSGSGRAKKRMRTTGRAGPAYRGGNYRLGGYVGKELKFLDHDASWIGPSKPTELSRMRWLGGDCLSTPAQGDGSTERIGRKFGIKSIQLNGVLRAGSPPDNEAPVGTVIANVYLILDRQCNKSNLTQASPNIVFLDGEGKPFVNLENTDRFHILKHQRVVVNPTHQAKTPNNNTGYVGWSGGGEKQFEMYVKCNIEVLCAPGNPNGGSSSTMNNAIYAMVAFSSTGNQSQMAPSISAKSRIRYCC